MAATAGAGLVLLCASLASAGDLPRPEGDVVLTISGKIGRTTDGTSAYFDLAMLEELGIVTIETSTPWSDGVERYEGVLARDVLKAVDAQGDSIIATALNDYAAEIPVSDFELYDVIFAFKADGAYLTPRDKGPLFVLYPYDSDADLRTEAIYARSVWQMTEIEVE